MRNKILLALASAAIIGGLTLSILPPPSNTLFVPLPSTFTITNLFISSSNNTVNIQWQSGTNGGPFNVWCATTPNGPWKVVASPVSNNYISLPLVLGNCYFRIEQPSSYTIDILDDNRFGTMFTDVYWAGAYIEYVEFAEGDCSVEEGCAIVGVNKLLRFPVTVWNPSNNSNWTGPVGPYYFYDECHHHFHMTNFSKFTLIGQNVEVTSQKMGWCVRNFGRLLDLGWNTNPPQTSCISPTLMPGWGDTYDVQSCMWFNITTNVPDGNYTMRIELDPLQVYGFYRKSEHNIQIINNDVIPF